MKKKVSVCIRHLADGRVSVEVADEEGKLLHSRIFGTFTEEEYALLLKVIDAEAFDRGTSTTNVSPSQN